MKVQFQFEEGETIEGDDAVRLVARLNVALRWVFEPWGGKIGHPIIVGLESDP